MENGINTAASIFKTNTQIVNKAIADVATEDWFRQPGNESNHLLWILGHLVVHRGQTLKYLGVDWNASWAPLFAPGAERVEDAKYPSVDEMRTAWAEMTDQLSSALRSASSEAGAKAAPQGAPTFDGKVSGIVAFFAFHDTYHTGQIGYLRKWLGYGETIG